MAEFRDIIGQEQLKEHLQGAIERNKVSHAYIINGERNSGKEFFAMALECTDRKDGEPCQVCHSCKQALSGNHPDIIFVSHEKPNVIGVDDIRNQINGDVAIKPYSSPKKIYIMNEGEKMTVQAQNALLKTLEEPPEYAVIIILTTNLETLLSTILSRCVVDVCVAFARGNVGKARLLAKSEEFDKVREEALALLRNIRDMEVHEMAAAIKKITEYQFDVNDYLDILSIWYRDVLLFKATHDVNGLIFREEIQYIRKVADRSTYEGIESIIEGLEKAKQRLSANVNFDLTMELLLLTIKENQ